jgi:hypothetical protein
MNFTREEQVAWNKSSLLQEQNISILQACTKIIKTESIYITKVIKMPSWKAWVQRPSSLLKMWETVQVLYMEGERISLIKVENVSQDQISVTDLNCCRILG